MAAMTLVKRILVALLEPWTSRKLWMTLFAVIIMQQLFWLATWYLYSFQQEWQAKYFVQMFFVTQGTITTMMLGYLGFSKTTTAGVIANILGKKDESKSEE